MSEAPTSAFEARPAATWRRWLPGLRVARHYRRGNLRGDIVAGLAVTALLVPQGMAYAELAGLPAVTGLYTTIMALLAYALFGPSRVLVLGPDSALAPLIFATVIPLVGADGDPGKAIALASMLALLMGAVCIVAGFAHLGTLAELLSKPVRIGYLNGIAIVVVVSQLPKLFGFSVDAESTPARFKEFVVGIANGDTVPAALAIGVACLVVLYGFKHIAPKVPAVLIAVVGATIAVAVFDLVARGVSVVGTVPQGFPTPKWPGVDSGDIALLLTAAIGMAFVTLADTSALSRTFALKYDDDVDPNQEIVALGTANIAAGLFQGFPVSASASRTAVAEAAGARSQLTGVVGALSIALLLIVGGGLTANMPQAALAAIVIVAGAGMFDLKQTRWLYKARRSEFVLCLAALLGVAVIGVLEGIAIALVLSIAAFVRRAWRPHDAALGRVTGRRGFHDIERNPDAKQVPELLVFRFDAPVFFANAEHFARCVKKHVGERGGPVKRVLIAGEPITDIDTTGAETLRDLVDDLAAVDIEFTVAELKGPVRDRLNRYGVYDHIGHDRFYGTIDEAIGVHLDGLGIDRSLWLDDIDDVSECDLPLMD
jgi:high affinity sulfate transporter 1